MKTEGTNSEDQMNIFRKQKDNVAFDELPSLTMLLFGEFRHRLSTNDFQTIQESLRSYIEVRNQFIRCAGEIYHKRAGESDAGYSFRISRLIDEKIQLLLICAIAREFLEESQLTIEDLAEKTGIKKKPGTNDIDLHCLEDLLHSVRTQALKTSAYKITREVVLIMDIGTHIRPGSEPSIFELLLEFNRDVKLGIILGEGRKHAFARGEFFVRWGLEKFYDYDSLIMALEERGCKKQKVTYISFE